LAFQKSKRAFQVEIENYGRIQKEIQEKLRKTTLMKEETKRNNNNPFEKNPFDDDDDNEEQNVN
jgi:hypothetical protein